MDNLLQVYSYPRSGLHYLIALLKRNFYAGRDDVDSRADGRMQFGHWSERQVAEGVVEGGKLFAVHGIPPLGGDRSIYLFRDGRAVALSVWRSKHFLNKSMATLRLTDFLRTKLDWLGSPGRGVNPPQKTVIEDWFANVLIAHEIASGTGSLMVRFEELVRDPVRVMDAVADKFGAERPSTRLEGFCPVTELVGPSPNEGAIDSWRSFFSSEDHEIFHSIVPRDCPYLDDDSMWNSDGFDPADYWNKRFAVSSLMYGGPTKPLLFYCTSFINKFIRENEIYSVMDHGCGDGEFFTLLGCDRYTGIDLSEEAVRKAREKTGGPFYKEFYTRENIPPEDSTDLCISINVIFHLTNDDGYDEYMTHLFDRATKYVLIFSSNHEDTGGPPHMRHHKFTDWVENNRPEWELVRVEPNPLAEVSVSKFYVFKRRR